MTAVSSSCPVNDSWHDTNNIMYILNKVGDTQGIFHHQCPAA